MKKKKRDALIYLIFFMKNKFDNNVHIYFCDGAGTQNHGFLIYHDY